MIKAEELCLSTTMLDVFGRDNKQTQGTGFFYEFDFADGLHEMCLVTNRHVLENAKKVRAYLTFAKDPEGYYPDYGNIACQCMILDDNSVIFHPDKNIDLAIIPIGNNLREQEDALGPYCYRCMGKETLPSNEEFKEISVMHDIVMVGYPDGLIDSKNNAPICRRGIIATPPNLDYCGEDVFLIDIACTQGSSGSPVLAYDFLWKQDPDGKFVKVDQIRLMGIFSEGENTIANGVTSPHADKNRQLVTVRIPSGVGKVIKIQRLLDFNAVLTKKYQPLI